ncbi:hypothetical protein [uncultured Parabacteroides sp.]|uniref:Uncharacterized protein n=3 Tax=root TaxID=1 RepID=A0A8S5U9L0_9CAUD|nr:hypothetical protein [uncultured Parabacteroides sp.]DAF91062.1 MAG TPA: hypothetical protein [Siphoviridae sp. ct7aK2]
MLRRRMMGKKGLFKISNRPEDFGLLFLWCQPQRGFKAESIAFADLNAQVGEFTTTWPSGLTLNSPVNNQGKPEFDVCTQIKGDWVTPTLEQWKALQYVDRTKGYLNGVKGVWVGTTNDLTNGIFLPGAGYRNHEKGEYCVGSGKYGSSSLARDPNNIYAPVFQFDDNPNNPIAVYEFDRRNNAHSIRPVKSNTYVWDGNPATKDFVELGGVKWAKGNITGYK